MINYRTIIIAFLLASFSAFGQEWTKVEPRENCTARHENSLAAANGKLYLIGGRGVKPVESYDPETNTWTSHGETPLEMNHFQAITYNDEIWVLGAFTGPYPHEEPIGDIYIYSPENDSWRKGPPMPENRKRGAAGAFVYNDMIYLIGGEIDGHWDGTQPWFDVLNPATGEWNTLPDAPTARDHISASLVNDKLVIAGGRQSNAKTGKVLETTLPSVDMYDFKSGSWTTVADAGNIPTQRAGASAVTYGDLVLIIGGESGAQVPAHSEVEGFNTETMEWVPLPPLNQGRHGTGAVMLNGRIYTVAGSGDRGGGPELTSVEYYPVND